MKGMSRHSEMQDGCTFVCEGTVQGNLYHISDYPGLVAGSGTVQGELYRASDMFQIIQRLDWIEGAGGSNPSLTEQSKRSQPIKERFGLTPTTMQKPTDSFEQIDSGDWASFNEE